MLRMSVNLSLHHLINAVESLGFRHPFRDETEQREFHNALAAAREHNPAEETDTPAEPVTGDNAIA